MTNPPRSEATAAPELGEGDRRFGKVEEAHGAQAYWKYAEHRTRPRRSQNGEIRAPALEEFLVADHVQPPAELFADFVVVGASDIAKLFEQADA